jgi:hypothetical protein
MFLRLTHLHLFILADDPAQCLDVWDAPVFRLKISSFFMIRIVHAMCEEGNACYAQKDYEAAERKYRQALHADPDHVRSLCCLAWLLRSQKNDLNAARGLIARACEVAPTVRIRVVFICAIPEVFAATVQVAHQCWVST